MQIFNKLKSVFSAKSLPSPAWASSMDHIQFMRWDGDVCSPGFEINLESFDGIDVAYKKCSTIQTITNRAAMSMSNGKWWIVDKSDNDVSDKYKDLQRLLLKPNPIQSWTEFIIQMDVYRQLYGEVFIWAVKPVGYSVQEASALWVINPSYISIEQTGRMYLQSDIDSIVLKYYLGYGKEKVELDKDCLLHIRDTNQNLAFGPDNIRGISRLHGLYYPVRNIIQAEEAIYSLNRDRGAQGILSNETKDNIGSIAVTEEEKKEIQRYYHSRYGLSEGQSKIIITNANLKWQQMSYNVKDLMLFEGISKNIQTLTDAFGYPYELLANDNGATYVNKAEAKKWFYQDTVIPISKVYAEKFSKFFQLDNDSIYIDFSDVECLKESEKEAADALYRKNEAMRIAYEKGVVSKAEWRLYIGYDEDVYKPDQNE